jgi:hypothetical protein
MSARTYFHGCSGRLSSDSVQYLISKYVIVVQQTCRTQTRNAARTSTQRRDRAVTSRRRPGGHCTLARGHEFLEPHKSISTPILRSKSKHFRRHGHHRALDGLLTFLKNLYSMPIMPRSKREWPRPQASRAESIRHNSSSRGERCPQPKKLRPFPTSQRVRFTAVIPESRASATNLAERGFHREQQVKRSGPQGPFMTVTLTF